MRRYIKQQTNHAHGFSTTSHKHIQGQVQSNYNTSDPTMCLGNVITSNTPVGTDTDMAPPHEPKAPTVHSVLEDHGIVLGNIIGSGGQGDVYIAYLKGTKQFDPVARPVAVKIIKRHDSHLPIATQQRIDVFVRREIQVLKSIHNEKCLEIIEDIETDDYFYIVSEYLAGYDLFEQAYRHLFTETEILQVIQQVLQALEYLHKNGMAHRDVKLENIVFCKPCRSDFSLRSTEVKLIDFGLAYSESIEQRNFRAIDNPGTIRCRAPEVITEFCYDPRKADMWALGVLTYILFAGNYPFLGETDDEIVNQILHRKELYLHPRWRKFSIESKKLVQGLLTKDPSKRWSLNTAKEWIQYTLDKQSRVDIAAPLSPLSPASASPSSVCTDAMDAFASRMHEATQKRDDQALSSVSNVDELVEAVKL